MMRFWTAGADVEKWKSFIMIGMKKAVLSAACLQATSPWQYSLFPVNLISVVRFRYEKAQNRWLAETCEYSTPATCLYLVWHRYDIARNRGLEYTSSCSL